MVDTLMRLKTQVETLKKGELNLELIEILIENIVQAVTNKEVTWKDLGTNLQNLSEIRLEALKKEFLGLCQAYKRGEKELKELEKHFAKMQEAIIKGEISFRELAPFTSKDFFELQVQLKVQKEGS